MNKLYLLIGIGVCIAMGCKQNTPAPVSAAKAAVASTSSDTIITQQCQLIPIPINGTVPGDQAFFGSQGCADCFAWKEFIALNWSSDPNANFGTPWDTTRVQWETYMVKEVLFQPNGAPPPAWGTMEMQLQDKFLKKLPAQAKNLKVMLSNNKFTNGASGINTFSIQQASPQNKPNWLGAQNGSNAWYEVRLNKPIYDYVTTNQLYNANNQYTWLQSGKTLSLPKAVQTQTGAMEIKGAWIEVTDRDNPKWRRFKLSAAIVIDPITGTPRQTLLALVGLHIIHKTASQPTWVWATFEHVDNVAENGVSAPATGYNFYNPNCQAQTVSTPSLCAADSTSTVVTVGCTPNTTPPFYLCKGGHAPVPIQVSRVNPLDKQNAIPINQQVQQGIAKYYPESVWQYYQLVDVVWSTSPSQEPSTPATDTVPRQFNGKQPNNPVANTTMETYVQTKNCIDCHRYATAASSQNLPNPSWSSDFSFAMSEAQYPMTKRVVNRSLYSNFIKPY